LNFKRSISVVNNEFVRNNEIKINLNKTQ
jgi:hypothetical protein